MLGFAGIGTYRLLRRQFSLTAAGRLWLGIWSMQKSLLPPEEHGIRGGTEVMSMAVRQLPRVGHL